VNKRLQGALEEIAHRHSAGTNVLDDPDRAPTGSAYQSATWQQVHHQQSLRTQSDKSSEIFKLKTRVDPEEEDESADSSEDDEFFKDDPEIELIRQRRLDQLRQQQTQEALHKSLGHGQYRTISQDEFLTECTGQSIYVAVHFFHRDFERCKIMDHHLQIIATKHIRCKFVRIDAEKAPFFVDKLQVRTLPTLFVFNEGKVVQRLTGFEGLAMSMDQPDQWDTPNLEKWLHATGAITYVPTEEDKAIELERIRSKSYRGGVWRQGGGQGHRGDHDDDDD
jgi:thiol-disulfide isomerase/thioredoxin